MQLEVSNSAFSRPSLMLSRHSGLSRLSAAHLIGAERQSLPTTASSLAVQSMCECTPLQAQDVQPMFIRKPVARYHGCLVG